MGILRRIYRRKVSKNPQTNSVDNLASFDEFHKISDEDGSLDSVHIDEESSQNCGCFGPPGGRCAEPGCGVISCVRCHQHCGGTVNPVSLGCGKPLCRQHQYHLQLPDGRTIAFCKKCYGQIVRRARWIAVGRFLLQPFIENKKEQ